jgi:hypothetical protein
MLPRHQGSSESCAVSIDADPVPGTPVSRRCQARPSHDPHTHDDVRGLEVSLCGLSENELIQRQIRHRSTKSSVLGLKLLQPLHLVTLQAAVLIPPSIIRDFRHANRPHRVGNQLDLVPSAHRPAAASLQFLQPYAASLPSISSSIRKSYFREDHFKGGSSNSA